MDDKIKEAIEYVLNACCGNRNHSKPIDIKSKVDELMMLDLERESTDFPEKYVCPLSGEIMRDPVKVPVRKRSVFDVELFVNCEHSFMMQWLLDNNVNPFDRSPLSLNDLVINDKLKREINDYLESEISQAQRKPRQMLR